MKLLRLRLRDFRNYREAETDFDPGINVISGENAQGKTNLLEAVWMLSGGRSFRTRFDRELIALDADSAELDAAVSLNRREQRIRILLQRGRSKQIFCNGVRQSGYDLGEKLKAVLFSPDDLNLIRDGAGARRRLMDLAIGQLRPGYAAVLSDYRRVYENKTRLLRDYRNDSAMLGTLDTFSDSLARLSAKLIRYRSSFARRLGESAAPIHRAFTAGRSPETLELRYATVSTVTDPTASETRIYEEILAHQRAHREAELSAGVCLTGAHKDDLEISLNGRPARTYASQGQTRTAALSLKLAEREIILQETGEYPILLLDDVLSELDSRRQEFVLNRIGGGQTLITCCEDAGLIAGRTGGRILIVQNGNIVKEA
ncbi:MAG: DNA replication/repair protein RecF [Oscillospiraceae bacterium]|nr:DNA replication/repair protein RecF [Oscillospiraceae bacterium]